MHLETTYYLVAIAVGVLAGIKPTIALIRWYNARLTKQGAVEYQARIKDEFIYQIATNHLPHIDSCLNLIAKHLQIELPEPPPINWLPYDPSKK